MCKIEYRVSGDDVNDFMVMETYAYYAYSLRHIYNFMNELGYSRLKLNKLKICLNEQRSHIEIFKPLMFGNEFIIELRVRRLNYNLGYFEITCSYFNSRYQRCAIVKSQCKIQRMDRNEMDNGVSRKIIDQIQIFADW